MSIFEFVFSLFGLVLGLSLAEVLAGFARTVQARRRIRMGWLTPLLGLLLMIDLVSFWVGAWNERDSLRIALDPLLFATLIAGIYYVAASLVFPSDHEEWPDLDDYFMAHKQMVAGAVLTCNLLLVIGILLLHGTLTMSPGRGAGYAAFTITAFTLIFTRSKRLSLVMLLTMIALYWLAPLIGAAIDGPTLP